MSEIEDVTTAQLARVVTIWPVLRGKPEVVDEMRRAILRHATKLDAEDIRSGVDDCIANSPTSGWPPGPHEVVGCIIVASKRRMTDERTHTGEIERTAPGLPRTEVVGRTCDKCAGPLMLLPEESAVYCVKCSSVVVKEWHPHPRFTMTWGEKSGVITQRIDDEGAGVQEVRDVIEKIKSAGVQGRHKHGELTRIALVEDRNDVIEWG